MSTLAALELSESELKLTVPFPFTFIANLPDPDGPSHLPHGPPGPGGSFLFPFWKTEPLDEP